MEPIIEMDSNIPIIYSSYRKCLSDKIKLVCSKVRFSYEGIKWIIFDPKISDIYGNKTSQIQHLLIGSEGKDYGACNSKDTIWISTLAIKRECAKNSLLKNINEMAFTNKLTNKRNKEDFLADVILDEIAHISTRCNHGDKKYDAQLAKFKDLYYNDMISRMLNNKTKK